PGVTMSRCAPAAAVAVVLVILAPAVGLGQVNVGANFQSMTVAQSGFIPPDTTGAVGPNHFMQYNNGRINFFRKDGTAVGTSPNETTFWVNAGLPTGTTGNPAGDPRLLYDPLSGRWFATAFTGQSTNNNLIIARSETADPTGVWK